MELTHYISSLTCSDECVYSNTLYVLLIILWVFILSTSYGLAWNQKLVCSDNIHAHLSTRHPIDSMKQPLSCLIVCPLHFYTSTAKVFSSTVCKHSCILAFDLSESLGLPLSYFCSMKDWNLNICSISKPYHSLLVQIRSRNVTVVLSSTILTFHNFVL